jgi:hypothetical protein
VPVAVQVATVSAPFNQGVVGLFNALQAFLTAHPGIAIVDVDFQRLESEEPGDIQRISILYETGLAIVSGWQVLLFETTPAGSAADNFTAAFGAGATDVPWFTIDVTRHKQARNTSQAFIVFCVSNVLDPTSLTGKNTWIAQPTADIPPATAGTATLYDGSGALLGVYPITNVSTLHTWSLNQTNYVILDDASGLIIGVPNCVAGTAWTPPAATTTTAYPLPAYVPQTPPVPVVPITA